MSKALRLALFLIALAIANLGIVPIPARAEPHPDTLVVEYPGNNTLPTLFATSQAPSAIVTVTDARKTKDILFGSATFTVFHVKLIHSAIGGDSELDPSGLLTQAIRQDVTHMGFATQSDTSTVNPTTIQIAVQLHDFYAEKVTDEWFFPLSLTHNKGVIDFDYTMTKNGQQICSGRIHEVTHGSGGRHPYTLLGERLSEALRQSMADMFAPSIVAQLKEATTVSMNP